jgi:3-phenylpropionate/cinnamic acid dioxygenase small subunit
MTSTQVTPQALIDFIAHEARLLDEQRLDEWNALFTDDGRYWLPAAPGQTDPVHQAAHLYDDKLLREIRIKRLQSPHAHSQRPPGRCHHLMQTSIVLSLDAPANRFELRTPFIYTELRAGHTTVLPGTAWHQLSCIDVGLRIQLKRVDLLHADTALPAIEFYL